MARYAMEFCAIESCGKCTPCRIGSTRGVEVIDRIIARAAHDPERGANLALLDDLCDTMLDGSLCALGGMTPFPVLSALKHFPEDFGLRRRHSPTRPADEDQTMSAISRHRLRHAAARSSERPSR